YSRGDFTPVTKRFQMENFNQPVKDAWGEGDSTLHINGEQDVKTHPLLKKFLTGALLFLLVSIGIALYMFFGGGNQVSSANVDIAIIGPSIVASGEQIDLGVSLVNENRTALSNVVFTVEYPEGARASADNTEPLKRTTENIKNIDKGSVHTTTTKLLLFGGKDVTKTIVFKMEYTVAGSNARFTKEKKYDVVIGSSPLLINVTAPQEINSGQQFQLQVTVTSNSGALLKNVLVKAEYPYGFAYTDSSLPPQNDKQTWNIGDLKNGEKKVFTIKGNVIAQDNEERTFRFMVGTEGVEQNTIETVLGTAMPTISLRKPFFNATLSLGGNTADMVAISAQGRVAGELSIVNSLADSLSNVVAEIGITGAALNKAGVRVADGGFYQSNQSVIVWDRNANSNFELLRPGETAKGSFDLENFLIPQNMKNPEISFEVTLKAVRSLVGGGVDNVTSTMTKKLRFLTNLAVSTRSLRGGVFGNTGPVPPVRDTASTYTIEWAVSNTHNEVSGAVVKATLPVYVDWVGSVSPATENVTYNADNRTVTWNAGTVPALAGYSTSAKKVFFQVKLNPSISQVGFAPALTNTTSVSGFDTWGNKTVSGEVGGANTNTADGSAGVVQ
ncbi:MAG: hypothetical protein RL292_229, partial [Candidatus Parcubacteria bacterium]